MISCWNFWSQLGTLPKIGNIDLDTAKVVSRHQNGAQNMAATYEAGGFCCIVSFTRNKVKPAISVGHHSPSLSRRLAASPGIKTTSSAQRDRCIWISELKARWTKWMGDDNRNQHEFCKKWATLW